MIAGAAYQGDPPTEDKSVSMVRKQLYITSEQERKLRELAARWGCTEAHVFRVALDRLADADESLDGRLAAAGLLVSPRTDDDVPTGRALEALERAYEVWASAEAAPIGLTEAVIEGRR